MKLTTCAECGSKVVHCDNDTLLDYPAVAYDQDRAQWTIMSFAAMQFASVGDASPDGMGHSLHEHQIEDS